MNPEKSTLDELRIDRSAPARKNSFIVIVVLAAILIGLASGVGWWIKRPNSAQVRTFTVPESTSGGNKTLLNSSGYVTARREATVSSKVTGKVVEVLIEEGMKVSEGQVLARLDDTNVKAALRLAEAQLEAANKSLEETRV